MRIADICGRYQVSVYLDTNLQEIAETMRLRNVGSVVVTDYENHPIGIITDRDIVTKAVNQDLPARDTLASAIMSRELVSVDRDRDLHFALTLMRKHLVRRIIVTDELGKLCGILSLDDVVQTVATDLQLLSELVLIQGGTKDSHRARDYTRMA